MKHILYTTKEGGDFRFKYISLGKDEDTVKMFNKAKKTGILEIKVGDSILPTPLAFIILLDELENFDFILKRPRVINGV